MLTAVLAVSTMLPGCGSSSSSSSSSADSSSSASSSSTSSSASDSSKDSSSPASQPTETLPADELTYASGTVLRMACGYNSDKTGMSFTADLAGEGITLADGKTYNSGDLKPTWQKVESLLDIKIEDKYQGNKAASTSTGMHSSIR